MPDRTAGHEEIANSSPAIRIHSERKWPERIVFDTTLPAVAPVRS